LAVLAVGGFGRRELFPYSDVDICLLVESDKAAEEQRPQIAAFIQELWDRNLRVSQSVRTVIECCEVHDQNVELNVALLDQRFLCGDNELYDRLEPKLAKFYETARTSLARHLCKLGRARHKQFQETIYHLEPNLKEGPGGLRDLQLVEWFRKLQTPGMNEILSEGDLEPSKRFLFQVRCFLHYRARRDNNVLGFEAQEELPEQTHAKLATPELWMHDVYAHIRSIAGAATRAMDSVESKSSSLLSGFRDWRTRLSNSDFTVARDRVYFKAAHAMGHDPQLAMRLFQFMARHGIPLSLEAERRVQEALPRLKTYFSTAGPHWVAVRELLSLPHTAMALRAMQDTGFLKLIFPEWEMIECCVVRDFYHRYTVDEHTLVTIESLQNLARTTEPQHRRFAGILSEIEEPAVLRFALLFHDIGKGARSGDHSTESTRLARGAMARIRMSEKDRSMVTFLIDQHLALSAAMTSRDLEDPSTARSLADKVGTIEALKYLTLMTYADIDGVNPTALSPWRTEQLWRVYLITHQELTRELQTDRINPSTELNDERTAFLKGLPVRYLRTHSEPEIQLHLDLERRRKDAEIALDVRKTSSGYQLTVVAKDRLYLFASVAGTLSSFGMNILKAEAFANQQGTILDTFVFADPQRTLELNPPELDRLQLTLERVLLGRLEVRDLLKYRPRPSIPGKRAMIEPRVTFNNEASDGATLVEVVAEDRPGLLYDMASALSNSGCSIEVVLVSTEAHRAMDVFYISHAGRKLNDSMMPPLRSALERACRG
jgi:[protein-PII] uridylyltransferase